MIRRGLRFGSALLILAAAFTASAGERILEFRSDVEIHRDGSFSVEERIVYSFGSASKHGIYRDVPVRYGRGSAPDYRIVFDVEWVRNGQGGQRPYEVSSHGEYQRIRIGSPNRTVTGLQEYRIRYRVMRGLLWLEEHDELYWNATGTEWAVPIDRAEVTVTTPSERPAGKTRSLCFTGRRGSVETACSHATNSRMSHFESNRSFGPREGLTVVIALPKGLLDEPSDLRKWLARASDYVGWTSALPFLVFGGLGRRWWRHGRDPAGPLAIPVRYEPPEDMTPAEMGTVLDETADLKDITSTILDLAVRGYLRIEETETTAFVFLSHSDYVLHRIREDDARLRPYEMKLLTGLLGSRSSVALSSLKNEFYTELPGIRKALYESVSSGRGWFPTSPDAVRKRYAAIGLAITIPLALVALFLDSAAGFLSFCACGVIAVFWSRFMPRRSTSGRRARQHIRGFQEFLERVEVDRLERMGIRNLEQFERLLPYAFVLGAADEWAEAFADLYREPPAWFSSRSGGLFHPHHLVDRVGRALDSAGSSLSSRPRGSGSSGFSGGGGASGGGFGGGGGGSW